MLIPKEIQPSGLATGNNTLLGLEDVNNKEFIKEVKIDNNYEPRVIVREYNENKNMGEFNLITVKEFLERYKDDDKIEDDNEIEDDSEIEDDNEIEDNNEIEE